MSFSVPVTSTGYCMKHVSYSEDFRKTAAYQKNRGKGRAAHPLRSTVPPFLQVPEFKEQK